MAVPDNFVATVRAQPWYGQVKQEMDAQNVPEYLWIAIIADENSGLQPNIKVADHYISDGSFAGYRYGLFQDTDPASNVAGNPNQAAINSGRWAAQRLGPALAKLPQGYSPQDALKASEVAAWPGQSGTAEEPTRIALLNQVLQQQGNTAGGNNSGPFSAITNLPGTINAGIDSAINNATKSAGQAVSGIAQQAFIGGAILAIIAGGFTLLASEG
jgi:hypothetical protein